MAQSQFSEDSLESLNHTPENKIAILSGYYSSNNSRNGTNNSNPAVTSYLPMWQHMFEETYCQYVAIAAALLKMQNSYSEKDGIGNEQIHRVFDISRHLVSYSISLDEAKSFLERSKEQKFASVEALGNHYERVKVNWTVTRMMVYGLLFVSLFIIIYRQ
jgi:hypothetical protein